MSRLLFSCCFSFAACVVGAWHVARLSRVSSGACCRASPPGYFSCSSSASSLGLFFHSIFVLLRLSPLARCCAVLLRLSPLTHCCAVLLLSAAALLLAF